MQNQLKLRTQRIRISLSTMLVVVLTLAAPGLAQSSPTETVYRVAIDSEYRPYEFVDSDGSVQGFTPALLRIIGESAGVRFEFIPLTWPEALEALETGQVDLLNMIYTPERAAQYGLSQPHSQIVQAIFRHTSASEITDLDSLSGKVVGFQDGDIALEQLAERTDIKRLIFQSKLDGLLSLNLGKIDAFLCAQQAGVQIISAYQFTNIALAAGELFPLDFVFAARQGNSALIALLDEQIEHLRASGQLQFLDDQWLKGQLVQPSWLEKNQRAIIIGSAGLVSVLLMALFWVISLRRQVRLRTQALTTSEQHYRLLFENSPAGLAITDGQGGFLAYNQAALEPGGYLPEDMARIGNVASLYYNPDDRNEILARLSEQGSLQQHEVRFKRKDGSPYDVLLSLLPINIAEQPCTLALLLDITQRKQTEQALLRQITELDTLYEHGLAISTLHQPQDIARATLKLLSQKLAWHHATIRSYDERTRTLQFLAFNQPGSEENEQRTEIAQHFQQMVSTPEQGRSGWVVAHKRSFRSGDLSNDPHYVATYPDLRSGLYTPIMRDERVLGVISVESQKPEAFNETDQRLLFTLAGQLAAAFENSRLLEDEIQNRKIANTLRSVNQALTESLDPDQILNIVLEKLHELIHYDSANFMAINAEGNLTVRIMRGYENWHDPELTGAITFSPEENSLFHKISATGQSLYVPDTRAEPDWEITPGAEHVRSWLGVPVSADKHMLGIFSIDWVEPNRAREEQIRLAEAIAAQAAMALRNAQLYEQTQQHTTELSILYNAALAATTPDNVDDILNQTMTLLKETLGPDNIAMLLLEPESNELVIRAFVGFPNGPTLMRRALGVGIPGWVAQTGEAVLIPDTRTDERYHACDEGARSELCVPLRIGDRILGAINLESRAVAHFTERDQRLLSTLAGHLSAMIDNARLLEETKRHARELEDRVYERTERLQSIAVAMAGREIRMAELKDVIQKLRAQLEEAGIKPAVNDPILEDIEPL